MSEEEYNPNAYRYYGPDFGAFFNHKCPNCDTGTWQAEIVHTMSEGHAYFHRDYKDGKSQVVGVIRGVLDKTVEKAGIYCKPCDMKLFPDKRKGYDHD